MKKLVLCGLSCIPLLLALAEPVHAHGGRYRGPADVVPPNPGGGGRTPGSRAPSTGVPKLPRPRQPGPVTPGQAGPLTGNPAGQQRNGNTLTGRGVQLTPDLGTWQFWWEFNRDPFIDLKEALHAAAPTTGSDVFYLGIGTDMVAVDSLRPTEKQIVTRVLPALKRALDGAGGQRDIVSSCLVAMAKIGKDHATFKILDVMRPYLKETDQEVRETAALAMGISQMPEAMEDLIDLASDNPRGRELCARSQVDDRTRAFACYGLGLIANATGNVDLKRTVYEAAARVLADTTNPLVDRNVPVAAVNAIRLVRPNADGGVKHVTLLADCLETLWSFYEKKDAKQTEQQVQAHVLTAVAQLLGRGGDGTGRYKDILLDLLEGKLGKKNNALYQSAVIALGMLAQPQEIEKGDKKYSDGLLKYSHLGKDAQARSFALMALAKIGGNSNRNHLLTALATGKKALVKPWAAIALGVLAFENAERADGRLPPDIAIGKALHRELAAAKAPETRSAMAVALGLCRWQDAADELEHMLVTHKHQDELAGYLCLGLALMNSRESLDTIQNLVRTSRRRPALLQQAAIALGKMGDKRITRELRDMLAHSSQTVASLSAIAGALGFIGDSRTIDPLVEMMHDESITPLSRAFAAVALGGIADKEPLPWNSKIGVDMNYRAAVSTLTNGLSGVLDIR